MKKHSLPHLLLLWAAPLALLTAPILASAQFSSSTDLPSSSFVAADPAGSFGGPTNKGVDPSGLAPIKPLSRIALGVGVSPLGIGMQAVTNINSHINIRGTGNLFNYSIDNINTEGFNVKAKLNLASAGASVDFYPFHSGFRLSPGVLFYNQNKADVTFLAAAGTSFTLNNHTYYSDKGDRAVIGTGAFGLGNGQTAFTATTGWGNVIPRSGRHWSFPVEIGVAFIKSPSLALGLTGYICDAQGLNCVDVATDATAQADLAAQVKKYRSDFDPLKTFPIVSFGFAYNFRIR